MGLNSFCFESDPCEKKFNRFIENTCEHYKDIERKLIKYQPHYRICCLSLPRKKIKKYKPAVTKCCFKRDIEIVHPKEYPYTISTRLNQLAFPSVRKLLDLRSNNKNLADRYYIVNRHIREGLLSVYSRLANIQTPPEKIPVRKWTAEEWKMHTKLLKKLACPKLLIQPPKIKRASKPIAEFKKSLKKLAKPRKYIEFPPGGWIFHERLRKHKPSKRIKDLAVPKESLYEGPLRLPIKVPEAALSYKPSPRVKELAQHRERTGTGGEGLKENPFEIPPNALKAKASKRTKELAEPKELENPGSKVLPWIVSPNALKAKASQRVLELAQPKGTK